MELLIAFLMAFGVITADDAKSFKSVNDAQSAVSSNNLDNDYQKWIWAAEADDF